MQTMFTKLQAIFINISKGRIFNQLMSERGTLGDAFLGRADLVSEIINCYNMTRVSSLSPSEQEGWHVLILLADSVTPHRIQQQLEEIQQIIFAIENGDSYPISKEFLFDIYKCRNINR